MWRRDPPSIVIDARETAVLRAEQARIHEMERRATADGHICGQERRAITQAQNNAARHIYQETHNRETANRPWYRRWS